MQQPLPSTVLSDPLKPSIRYPSLFMGAAIAAAIAIFVGTGILGPVGSFRAAAPGCALTVALAGAILVFIRVFYVRGTALSIDAHGLVMRQPDGTWRADWADIATVTVTSPLDITHRGGIATGVRLRLLDGTTRHIPDVLQTDRNALARLITARMGADHRPA